MPPLPRRRHRRCPADAEWGRIAGAAPHRRVRRSAAPGRPERSSRPGPVVERSPGATAGTSPVRCLGVTFKRCPLERPRYGPAGKVRTAEAPAPAVPTDGQASGGERAALSSALDESPRPSALVGPVDNYLELGSRAGFGTRDRRSWNVGDSAVWWIHPIRRAISTSARIDAFPTVGAPLPCPSSPMSITEHRCGSGPGRSSPRHDIARGPPPERRGPGGCADSRGSRTVTGSDQPPTTRASATLLSLSALADTHDAAVGLDGHVPGDVEARAEVNSGEPVGREAGVRVAVGQVATEQHAASGAGRDPRRRSCRRPAA